MCTLMRSQVQSAAVASNNRRLTWRIVTFGKQLLPRSHGHGRAEKRGVSWAPAAELTRPWKGREACRARRWSQRVRTSADRRLRGHALAPQEKCVCYDKRLVHPASATSDPITTRILLQARLARVMNGEAGGNGAATRLRACGKTHVPNRSHSRARVPKPAATTAPARMRRRCSKQLSRRGRRPRSLRRHPA